MADFVIWWYWQNVQLLSRWYTTNFLRSCLRCILLHVYGRTMRMSFIRFVLSTSREFLLISSTLHLFRTRGETLFHRLLRDASISDISWNFWNFPTNDICIFANNLSKQNAWTSSMQERKRRKFLKKFSRNACKSEYLSGPNYLENSRDFTRCSSIVP